MKTKQLLILGAVVVGAYLIYKKMNPEAPIDPSVTADDAKSQAAMEA